MPANIQVGDLRFTLKGELVQVTAATLPGSLQVTQLNNGKSYTLKAANTKSFESCKMLAAPSPDLATLSTKQLEQMKLRTKVVTQYLKLGKPTAEDARKAAEQIGLKPTRFYKLVSAYVNTRRPLSLVPHLWHKSKGVHKTDEQVDKIITEVLGKLNNKFKLPAAIREIQETCKRQKLTAPSEATIYRRHDAIPAVKRLAGTIGARQAHLLFGPSPLHYEDVAFPYHVLQIDHTPLDIKVVDDGGNVIGIAWLTLVIDVYTRMVAGIYLSYDKPSTTSVGAAILHAVMPKEQYLKDLGLAKFSWPCSGLMDAIHADNGADFRSEMLELAAKNNQINLIWRAVATPTHGGHIEALAKNLNGFVRTLSGSIPAGRAERRHEKPDTRAIYTITELTQQLVRYIVGVYHASAHSALGMSPLQKFQSCVTGTETQLPTGLRPPPDDALRLKLDFSPFELRTVQTDGVRINDITYYDPCLNPLIRTRNPDSADGKYLFRTPQADVSYIYYWDAPDRTYRRIPASDLSTPAMSATEWKEAWERLKAAQRAATGENILAALAEGRAFEEEIIKKRPKSSGAQKVRRTMAIREQQAQARGSTVPDSPTTTPAWSNADRDSLEPFT